MWLTLALLVTLNGFTSFQPMSGASCSADTDCATGETCQSGVCRRELLLFAG